MSYRPLAALLLGALIAGAAFGGQGQATRKLGPAVVSGVSLAHAPAAAKGAASVNGSSMRAPGPSAGATAVSGRR